MFAMLHLLGTVVANLFKSRRRLEIENLFLRHQLNVALKRAPRRLRLRGSDRAVLVWLTWLWSISFDVFSVSSASPTPPFFADLRCPLLANADIPLRSPRFVRNAENGFSQQ
jgi:hypothetical protein